MMKKFNPKWYVNLKYLLLSLCLTLNPQLLKASPIWVSSINGGVAYPITSPAGIAFDYSSEDPSQQSIFVSDKSANNRIIKFNGLGQNPSQFNNALNSPLNSPNGLAIGINNDNYLWIASRFEETTPGLFGKIRTLKSDGSDSLRLPDDLPANPVVTFNRPYSVAIDTYRQRAYVLDNNKVQSFTATSAVTAINPNLIAGLSVPKGIAVKPLGEQPTGEILIADSGNNIIKKYNTNGDLPPAIIGATGVGNGQFQSPTGVAVVDTINSPIWVVDNAADNANYQLNRLQVFDKDGNFLNKVDNINVPNAVSVNPRTGIVAVAEFQDQIKMFFDPRAWVLSGKSILPQLPLNLAGGELELAPGALINRRLVVTASASGDNISIPAGTNNGLLTLENATLKLTDTGFGTGSGDNRLEADAVELYLGGNLVLNGGKFKIDNLIFDGGTLKVLKDATIPTSVSPNPNVVKLSPQGGTIDVDNGRTLTVQRSFKSESNNDPYTLTKIGDGNLLLNISSTSIDKNVDVQAGSFTINNTSLTFESGASLKVHPGARFVTLPTSVNGVSNLAISSGAVAENSGFIDNQGFWVLYGTLTNSGTFTNYSTGSIPAGTGNFKFKGGTFDTYSNATVNWNISLDNDNGTIITRGGRTFTITQPITGNGNLTISGPGTTVLNGSNSYNGSTSITSQATVKFTANSPFGLGNVSIQDGSTLQWGSAVTLPNNFTFFATIPTLDTSTYNGGISGKLSGGIGFIKKGSGSLTLSGNNDYDDSTTIEEGTLIAAHNNALGTASVYMKNGTVFQSGLNGLVLPNANNFILDSGSLATSGTVTINTANNFTTLSGTISQNNGPMKLIVQGGRTLTLGGQASHSGGTDVQGGTTLIAGLANLFTSANHNLSLLDANSIFDMSAGNQTLGNINGVTGTFIELGNKTLTFGTSNDFNIASGIDGVDGKIVKQGTGTLTVSGNNSYSGGTTINAGAVRVNHNNAFGSGNVTMKDGTTFFSEKTLSLFNSFTLDGNPVQGITFDTKTFSTFIFNVIDGMNKLIIKGSGALTMRAQNLFTGGVELYDSAKLFLDLGGNLPNGSNVKLLNSDTGLSIESSTTPVILGALNGVSGSFISMGNKTLTVTKNSSFNGNFISTGNSRVIVDGSSTLELGDNTPGTLQINANSKVSMLPSGILLYSNTNIDLAGAGAIFDGSAISQNINLGTLNGVAGTTFKWNGTNLTLNGPAVSSFDGILEGGEGSTIYIKANTTLGGDNSDKNTRSWFIFEPLIMKANGILPTQSTLTFNSNNAVFDMSAQSQTIYTVFAGTSSSNSLIKLGDKTLTLNMQDPNPASVFRGTIEGVGGKIIKRGPAVMVFSGANTFSGGLFIEEGGVRISSPSGMGTGPITIYDQAILDTNTSLTISNPITLQGGTAILRTNFPTIIDTAIKGDGGFNKTGASPLTLTQANEYKGDTFINQGTLIVNGKIGNVTVGSGTVLTGTGSVGDVVNNGTVTPSDPVGVFTINGDYLPTPSGITRIAINPVDSNNLLVKGTAHLNDSKLKVDVVPGNTLDYENHEPFLILESNNPVDGQFGAIESSLVRFTWTADYQADPKKVFLDANYVPFEKIVRSVSDNPNTIAAAHYVDSLPQPVADPDLKNILAIFNSQPEAYGITDVFSEITPDELLLAEETASLVNEINGFRMHYLRDMMASPTASASFTTTRTQKATALINQLKQAFGQVRADDPRLHSPAMAMNIGQQMQDNALIMGPKGGIWIQGFGNTSRQKATDYDMGYRNKMAGSLIGVDYKLRPDLFVGLSFGYDQSRIKWTDALSKGKIKDYLASLHSTWFQDQFYINASMTGSFNRYNIRRRMIFGPIDRTARSRHDGYVLAPSLEVGQGFTLFNGIDVVPFVRGDYIHIHEKSYTEKEAGALNLHIRSKTNTALRTEPGLNFYRHFKQEEGIITAKVKLSYVNKHPLKKGKITANLVGQPGTFLASGTNKTQHQVSPGLSLDYKANSGLFVSAAYDAQFSSKYKAHEISLKIGTKF